MLARRLARYSLVVALGCSVAPPEHLRRFTIVNECVTDVRSPLVGIYAFQGQYCPTGPSGIGYACVVDRRGYLLTADHLYRSSADVLYVRCDATTFCRVRRVYSWRDVDGTDLCLVAANCHFAQAYDWSAERGSNVLINTGAGRSPGVVTHQLASDRLLVHDVHLVPGHSGSAVEDPNGGLVGVNVATHVFSKTGLAIRPDFEDLERRIQFDLKR